MKDPHDFPGGLPGEYVEPNAGAPIDGGDSRSSAPQASRATRTAPLSFAQERMWVLNQLHQDSPIYNVSGALELHGRLDTRALEGMFNQLVTRHESLRTTFELINGNPLQLVHPVLQVDLPAVDLSLLEPADQERAARLIAEREARRPFTLSRGPLLRAMLIRVGSRRHIVVFTMHHIVCDGWSAGVLVRDMAALYESCRANTPCVLPALPRKYTEYAVQQRQRTKRELLERERAYWIKQLEGARGILDWPTGRAPRSGQGGELYRFSFPPALAAAVREFSRRSRVTLFVTLLAAFEAVIFRHTGRKDFIIGSSLAKRDSADLESLVGCFVNSVALRAKLSGEQSFAQLLAAVRRSVTDAVANSDVPLEDVVDAVRPERDAGRTPLFQTMFVMQNAPVEEMSLPELSLRPVQLHNGTARFDITLEIADRGSALTGTLEYSTELFEQSFIACLVEQYQTLLESAVREPARPVANLTMLTSQQQRLPCAEEGSGRESPALVHDRIDAVAARAGRTRALVSGKRILSYQDLRRQSDAVAGALRAQREVSGCSAAVLADDPLDVVVMSLGIMKAGGASVALDPSKIAIGGAGASSFGIDFAVAMSASAAHQMPGVATVVVREDALRALEREPAGAPPVLPGSVACRVIDSEESGRAVLEVTHHVLAELAAAVLPRGQRAQATVLCVSPLESVASLSEVWGTLMNGGSCILDGLKARSAERVADLVRQHAVTVLRVPAALLSAVLKFPERLATLKTVFYDGGAQRSGVQRRLRSLRSAPQAWQALTCSGAAGPCLAADASDHGSSEVQPPRLRPVGRGTRACVLTADMQLAPVGAPGEIYVGGPLLLSGYSRNPGRTAERLLPDPLGNGERLYGTGIVGRCLPDGSIVSEGLPVALAAGGGYDLNGEIIERAVLEESAVSEVVTLRKHGARGGWSAYLVADQGTLTTESLRGSLEARLLPRLMPQDLVILQSLPLRPDGHVDLQALMKSSPGEATRGLREDEPRTQAEGQLTRIWAAVLMRDRVGIHDNFFEIGGDSILGIQIAARAHEVGLPVQPQHIFESQTISRLAQLLERAGAPQSAAPESGATLALTPIQREFFEAQGRPVMHFNQAVMLRLAGPMRMDTLHAAVWSLLNAHDALRLRFERVGEEWVQRCEPFSGADVPFTGIATGAIPPQLRSAMIGKMAAQVQGSLDVCNGPMFRALAFGESADCFDALLLVIHHLAVDAVSWPILLADLAASCDPTRPPAATAGSRSGAQWQQWVQSLLTHARSDAVAGQAQFWLEENDPHDVSRLPVDSTGLAGVEQRPSVISGKLGRAHTRALLARRRSESSADIEGLLLTALARTLARWSGAERLWVDVERHGREPLFPQLDVSRTVGWFTTKFPLALECALTDDRAAQLSGVTEALKRVPGAGLGYGLLRYCGADGQIAERLAARPRPEVCFTYLGHLDSAFNHKGLRVDDITGAEYAVVTGSQYRRPHLFEVSCSVIDGEMSIAWIYDRVRHRASTVHTLLESLKEELQELGEACTLDALRGVADGVTEEELRQLTKGRPDIEDVYATNPMQESMLLRSVFAPRGNEYIEQVSMLLEGVLDVAAFVACWSDVLARHPSLRTEFAWEEVRNPVQIVRREVAVELQEHDWRGRKAIDREVFLATLRARGLDPSRAPLMRWDLARISGSQSLFVWSFHHALLDGWSMALVLGEVFRAYEARREARLPSFGPAGAYREYIQWIGRRDPSAAEIFWRARLAGFRTPTPLPLASAGGGAHRQGVGEERLELGSELTQQLQAFCRGHQVTLSTLLQGAWALVLAQHGGTHDVVFGTTVSGRPPQVAGIEGLAGMFINTLPTRVRVDPRYDIRDWLQRLQVEQVLLREYSHTSLLQLHQWSELDPSAPLFETQLVFENYPTRDLQRANALKVGDVRVFEHADVPLLLLVLPGGQLTIKLKFDRSRFEPDAMRVLLERFARLLMALSSGVQKVADLSLLRPGELDGALRKWNRAECVALQQESLPELFSRQAALTPDNVAIVCGHERLTYAELDEKASLLAGFLLNQGVCAETPIPLFVEGRPEMVVGVLGILKAGAVLVPLDRNLGAGRIQRILQGMSAPLILTQQALLGQLPRNAPSAVLLDSQWSAIASGGARGRGTARVEPAQLAYVMYTSGSTGLPKGVMITHRGLANYVLWCARAYEMHKGEGSPVASPLTFDLTITALLAPLAAGRPVTLLDRTSPIESLAAALGREVQYTLLKITPAHLALLSRTLPARAARASRALIVGGEALYGESLSFWRRHAPETRVINEYGPTEATVGCCTYSVRAGDSEEGSIPIGTPITNMRVYVLDRELRPVLAGVKGEICVAGMGLARGYWHSAGMTAERFIPDPFAPVPGERLYRTGDVGWFDEAGVIHCGGRLDRQLKIRGYRVEPAEVEASIAATLGTDEIAVDISQDSADRCLVAYLGRPAGVASAAQLRQRLGDSLPAHMIPERVVVVDAMPLTQNGKVDREALRSEAGTSQSAHLTAVPRQSGTRRLDESIREIWKAALHLQEIDADANFFDLGGHSMLLARVQDRLREALQKDIPLLDLFKYPTIRSLAAHYSGTDIPRLSEAPAPASAVAASDPIAIIGMAGRFPGAATLERFWKNLAGGVESISFFADEQLAEQGISGELRAHAAYVRAGAVLDEIERFDAAFFGMSPREAELTDPQHRLFLECAQQALDDAGLDPGRWTGRVGVYAGCFMSNYLLQHLLPNPDLMQSYDMMQVIAGNDKDFLPTRVSYKLGLRGPSVSVQTACSTSLVAAHLACEALRRGECEAALAGGVSIRLPQVAGYIHHEQGTLSADGHCRAFDAEASGFVGGSGCGIVVLKRLSDALRDGDRIRAVIRGNAINNDGARKIGYTAPSIDGQAEVIRAALASAAVDPASISYVEAHGTGTPLGDPIEVAALTQVYGNSGARNACALGAVKTNIGHLDAAAGVAGLIKTVLQLEHRQLVPSLNFTRPNPKLDLAAGGFRVNTQLLSWDSADGPRRAGVSSFGIGGTNAHVVLEEAPARGMAAPRARDWQLLSISGRTESAALLAAERLRAALQTSTEHELADVAYTAHVGRREFKHRLAVVCRSLQEAVSALEPGAHRACEATDDPAVAFLFPGVDSVHADMGRKLYRQEPLFREAAERCMQLLPGALSSVLRATLFGVRAEDVDWRQVLEREQLLEYALFIVEYALAQLWVDWGVRPTLVMGAGTGEYVAATLAGVLTLADALRLLGVSLKVSDAKRRERLRESNVREIQRCVASIPWQRPTLPLYLASRAECLGDVAATDAGTWEAWVGGDGGERDATECLAQLQGQIYLEVGPGQRLIEALQSEARADGGTVTLLPSMGESAEHEDRLLARSLGEMWERGVRVDWGRYHSCEQRRRVELPATALEGSRFWIESTPGSLRHAGAAAQNRPTVLQKRSDLLSWLYSASWERCDGFSSSSLATPAVAGVDTWLLFSGGRTGELAVQLRAAGQAVIEVVNADGAQSTDRDQYRVSPLFREDFVRLLDTLEKERGLPRKVVFLWGIDSAFEGRYDIAVAGLLHLTQALSARGSGAVELTVVTAGAQEVGAEDELSPDAAAVLGFAHTIPLECPAISCRSIDLQAGDPGRIAEAGTMGQLLRELLRTDPERVVALRQRTWWKPIFKPAEPAATGLALPLKEEGVYWITGGTGDIGLDVARYLAKEWRARLVLIGRTAPQTAAAAQRVQAAMAELEAAGAEVLLLGANVGERAEMRAALEQTLCRFGALDGVFHAAGVRVAAALEDFNCDRLQGQMHAKAAGSAVLAELLPETAAKFCVVVSSLASVLGVRGFPGYASAHLYMDMFVRRQSRRTGALWLILNLDNWITTSLRASALVATQTGTAIDPEEGIEMMRRIVAAHGSAGQLYVSTTDLGERAALAGRLVKAATVGTPSATAEAPARYTRPELSSTLRAPRSALEKELTEIWESFLGVNPIGVEDDFFELGGDSVVSLQIIARAGEKGIKLTPQQFFDHPTIAQLAIAAASGELVEAEQGAVSGTAPLTPIQAWFFEQNVPDPFHWNMAMLLRPLQHAAPAKLRRVVQYLLAHHDALRTRFRPVNGSWEQVIGAPEPEVPFCVVDLRMLEESGSANVLESACTAVQRSLHLAAGPMLRSVYFLRRNPQDFRLLFAVHHLVIDAPSWRILLEDLESLCQQAQEGVDLHLPRKTTSYRAWSTQLAERAAAGAFDAEREFWKSGASGRAAGLPVDFGSGVGGDTEQTARAVALELSERETAALLHEAPQRFAAQANDLLVTALVLALREHARAKEVLVEFEGLGRDVSLENVDVSRTVGWFTAIYPVAFGPSATELPGCVAEVAARLRAVPSRGVGYGVLRYLSPDAQTAQQLRAELQAEVSFTYLGGRDPTSAGRNAWFETTEEPRGLLHSQAGHLRHRIAITALVANGRLRVHWMYSAALYEAATIEQLAARYMSFLRALLSDRAEMQAAAQATVT
jgi:amino acid adenylation domain-containing protein/non-ribosomal peptide synthase protein (TIGR01720 family)